MADKYEFLSDDWFEAARKIRDEFDQPASAPAQPVKMNLIITDAPFNEGADIHTHLDTSEGEVKMDKGHVESPDVTITVDYDTSKAMFVDENQAAGMQAFMAGKVKVQGDITKLMSLGQVAPDPSAVEVAQRIKEITA